MAVTGAEWQIAPVEPLQPAQEASTGFGGMLGSALESLATSQTEAAGFHAEARYRFGRPEPLNVGPDKSGPSVQTPGGVDVGSPVDMSGTDLR